MIDPAQARCDDHVGEYASRPGCYACQAERQEAEREAMREAESAREAFFGKTTEVAA